MKLFIVAAVLGFASAGRLDNAYLPPRGGAGSGASGFGAAANSFGAAAGGFGQKSGSFGAASGFGQSGGGGFGQSAAGFGQTQYSGNAYNAPSGGQQYNAPSGGQQYNAPAGGQQYNSRASLGEANAQILRSNSEVTAEGFSYDFETSNGIRADAQGVATNGVQSQGSFAYKGDDGQEYSITYTADENGYRPQGAHLPTPPPIPEAILKSLEQNARDEAAGISDDGTYRGEGAGSGAGGYSSGNRGYSAPAPSTQYGAPSSGYQAPQGGYQAPQGGYQAPQGGYQAPQGGYQAPQGGYQAPQGGFQAKPSFGGAASRQYLTPNAGPARSGNGNFNQQSGYQY